MMLMNLLDGWFKYDLGEGAFYAVFGFVFVFFGIALLILLFAALGKIMDVAAHRKKTKKAATAEIPAPVVPAEENGDAVSPEVVAAITAALTAFYEEERVKCEFVVKRIRKI